MTDSLDAAQAEIDRVRDAALQRHKAIMAQDGPSYGRGRPTSPAPETPSAMVCATCGDRIPDPRRHAVPGTQHCAHCAAHITRGPR